MSIPVDRPRVLLLHGMSSSGASKASFVQSLGFDVLVPRLPGWSFRWAVRIAQKAFDGFDPHLVVGSSRGGAVALHLGTRGRPLVLLSPAYVLFGGPPRRSSVPTGSVVIHSPDDPLVPYRHSVVLVRRMPGLRLIPAGRTHHLNCHGGREALRRAIRGLVPSRGAIGPGGGRRRPAARGGGPGQPTS